jgi:hypothetical protein
MDILETQTSNYTIILKISLRKYATMAKGLCHHESLATSTYRARNRYTCDRLSNIEASRYNVEGT